MNDMTPQQAELLQRILARSASGQAELQQPRAGLSLQQRWLLAQLDGQASLVELGRRPGSPTVHRLPRDAARLVALALAHDLGEIGPTPSDFGPATDFGASALFPPTLPPESTALPPSPAPALMSAADRPSVQPAPLAAGAIDPDAQASPPSKAAGFAGPAQASPGAGELLRRRPVVAAAAVAVFGLLALGLWFIAQRDSGQATQASLAQAAARAAQPAGDDSVAGARVAAAAAAALASPALQAPAPASLRASVPPATPIAESRPSPAAAEQTTPGRAAPPAPLPTTAPPTTPPPTTPPPATAPPTPADRLSSVRANAAAFVRAAIGAPEPQAAARAPAQAPTQVSASLAEPPTRAPAPGAAAAPGAPVAPIAAAPVAAQAAVAASAPVAAPPAPTTAAAAASLPAQVAALSRPAPSPAVAAAVRPQPLRPLSVVEPVFPRDGWGLGSRTVSLQARLALDAAGAVSRVEFVRGAGSGTRVFERAARTALLQWRFPPGAADRVFVQELSFKED